MICAPRLRKSSASRVLTEAAVPTGIKTGVRMIPWDVKNSQALALPDLPSIRKLMLSIAGGNIVAVDKKDQRYVGFLVPWLWRGGL
jgi:hypothetical protein